MAISEDCTITLDFSQIQPTSDLAFDLELIADGDYEISFVVTGIEATIEWKTPFSIVANGEIVVKFFKKIGIPILEGDLLV